MDDVALLKEQVAALLHRVVELEAQVAERDAQISELEAELERVRRQGYKPKPNRKPPAGSKKQDRRKKPFRQHPGVFRDTLGGPTAC
ncbi:hypothetical protein [Schlesneria sp. T3-172]|uniref:hypothetical protein n=1 Tax=Schlesneria sphaerica TaxID=3373610 RepID=UPI0037C6DA79